MDSTINVECWLHCLLLQHQHYLNSVGKGFHLLFECQNTNQVVRQVWRKAHITLETNRDAEQCCVGTLLWCLLTSLLCCHLHARLYVKADKTICSHESSLAQTFSDVNSEMFSFQLGGIMPSYRITWNSFLTNCLAISSAREGSPVPYALEKQKDQMGTASSFQTKINSVSF